MSESYVSCYMQVLRFLGDYKNKTFLLVIKHQRMQEGALLLYISFHNLITQAGTGKFIYIYKHSKRLDEKQLLVKQETIKVLSTIGL